MEKQVYNYEYYFERHGETCRRRGNNEIWVDVGNKLEVGIFDHHDNGYESTAQVLVENIELLKQTVENLMPEEKIRFTTHFKPDMDALVSIFLFKEYIEKGEAYFRSMYCEEKAKGKALVEYTNLIDQGKNKVISKPTLYALLSTLDSKEIKALWKNDKELSHNMVRKGLEWIQEYVDVLCTGEYEKPFDIELCVECDEEFQIAYKEIIQRSKAAYECDKKSNDLVLETIPLWTKTNEIREDVKAVIWKDIPSSEYSYLYAREEGADLTFVPYYDEEKKSFGVRVSINPDKKENAELSLLEVADVYERMEQISEKDDFLNNKGLRRDYSKSRGENPDSIFKKVPFVETEDPWYISDKEDMIDVPKKHRDLIYSELIEVVENITDMVEATYLVEIDRTIEKSLSVNVPVSKTGVESLFQWNARLTEALAKDMDKEYKLAIVRIGAGLIMHNYDLLDSYYMSLIGGSYVEKESMQVIRLDYRTHLYVNRNHAVLFCATESDTFEKRPLAGVLDITSEETIKNSELVKLITDMVLQRETLIYLGKEIGEFETKSNAQMRDMNEKLINILADMQSCECKLNSQTSLDIYQYIKQIFGLDELKGSVTDSMNLVSEHKKERLYGTLSLLSKWAIPFAFISTFVNMEILQLPKLFKMGKDFTGVSWCVAGVAIFLFVIVFVKLISQNMKKPTGEK